MTIQTGIISGPNNGKRLVDVGVCNPWYIPLIHDRYTDAQINADLDMMVAAGIKWIRLDFLWSYLEPTQGNFVWTNYDRLMNLCNAKGIKVQAILAYCTPWANGNQDPRVPPTDYNTYKTYCTAVVNRYFPMGVEYYEIWNEPNITFWRPSPNAAEYTALLKKGYEGVKAANAEAQVIFGALTLISTTEDTSLRISPALFLKRCYEAGAKDYFDIMAYHAYDWSNRVIASLYSVMDTYGDVHKEMWINEYGYPTGGSEGFTTEAGQATIITNGLNWASANPRLTKAFIYCFKDMPNIDPNDREAWFGIVKYDSTPKLAYNAVKTYNGK
jgi:beta-glucosidase/6-phospho-beta-glucosidase/beta-galactosidase